MKRDTRKNVIATGCLAAVALCAPMVLASPGQLLSSTPLAFTAPRDLAVAADNTLWVVDSGAQRVLHLSADGSEILASLDTRDFGITTPTGVALASDETLWIADWDNMRLVHRNSDGSAASGLAEIDLDALGLGDPLGIDVTSSGTFLVVDGIDGNEELYEISTDGESIEWFTSTSALGATFPQGVTEASDGTIWLSEADSTSLFNASGGSPSEIDISGAGFDEPRGIASLSDNTAWTIDGGTGVIMRHTLTGSPTLTETPNTIDFAGSVGLGLSSVTGLTRDPYGNPWVIDSTTQRAHCLNQNLTVSVLSFDYTPWSSFINEIDIAPDGTIYLTDSISSVTYILEPDASGTLGSFTKTDISASSLAALAVDSDGTLWALDPTALKVHHLTSDGSSVLGSITLSGASIPNPTDIEVAPSGNLWISNQAGGSSNLHQLKRDGSTASPTPVLSIGATLGITAPQSIAVFPDGDIQVINTGEAVILSVEGPPPTIAQAVHVDTASPVGVSASDELILVFDQAITLGGSLEADDFTLSHAGDSLGTGFTAEQSTLHDNLLILTLGTGANLTVTGSGASSSAIDISGSIEPGDIIDTVTNTDVSGSSPRDILFNFVPSGPTVVGPLGGDVTVVNSGDAVYLEHKLTINPGAVPSPVTLEIAVPQTSTGLVNVIELRPSGYNFLTPHASLTMEYSEHDLRALDGGDETEMRIHQLNPIGGGVYEAVPVPGAQTVDTEANTVTAPLSGSDSLNFGGVEIYATLPIDLVDDREFIIDESSGSAGIVPMGLVGGTSATLQIGDLGFYTKHSVSVPGYEEAPEGISLNLSEATIFDRYGFPETNGAIFVIETDSPLPVDVEVVMEFRDFEGSGDIVEMDGTAGPRTMMRLIRRTEMGGAWEFLDTLPAHVDSTGVVITGLVPSLGGVEGRAVYGLAVNPSATVPVELSFFGTD